MKSHILTSYIQAVNTILEGNKDFNSRMTDQIKDLRNDMRIQNSNLSTEIKDLRNDMRAGFGIVTAILIGLVGLGISLIALQNTILNQQLSTNKAATDTMINAIQMSAFEQVKKK